jgi:hypothetical protein
VLPSDYDIYPDYDKYPPAYVEAYADDVRSKGEFFEAAYHTSSDVEAVRLLQDFVAAGKNYVAVIPFSGINMSMLDWVASYGLYAGAGSTLRQCNRIERFKYLVSIAEKDVLNATLGYLWSLNSEDKESLDILQNAVAKLKLVPDSDYSMNKQRAEINPFSLPNYGSSKQSGGNFFSPSQLPSQPLNFIKNAIFELTKSKTPYWELLESNYKIDPIEARKELGSLQMELRRELNLKLGGEYPNFAPAIQAAKSSGLISKEQAKIYSRINEAANEAKHEKVHQGAGNSSSRPFSSAIQSSGLNSKASRNNLGFSSSTFFTQPPKLDKKVPTTIHPKITKVMNDLSQRKAQPLEATVNIDQIKNNILDYSTTELSWSETVACSILNCISAAILTTRCQ